MNTPTAGISFGISRLATIVDWSTLLEKTNNDCFVTTVGDISISDKLKVIKYLQESGKYNAVLYDLTLESRKLGAVLRDSLKANIGFIAIIAETEWNTEHSIQIKNLQTNNSAPIYINIPN